MIHPEQHNLVPARKILSEFRTPKSLSKILFIMLKYGDLKSHVNTLNYERKLCIQNLFEWSELIETVFFEASKSTPKKTSSRLEWQKEFKECIRLLLKSGADLLLLNSSPSLSSNGSGVTSDCDLIANNCVHTLITSILKASVITDALDHSQEKCTDLGNIIHSATTIFKNENGGNMLLAKKGGDSVFNMMRQRSPSLPLSPDRPLLAQLQEKAAIFCASQEQAALPKKNSFQTNKTVDIEFMYHLFNDVIDLAGD